MNILTDTCNALWFCSGDNQLAQEHREIMANTGNVIFFSAVSAAEIAIKFNIGKLHLPENPRIYVPELRKRHGFTELPLYENAALLLDSLPLLHRDPFDRLLICQAQAHNLYILTSDPQIRQYPGIQIL